MGLFFSPWTTSCVTMRTWQYGQFLSCICRKSRRAEFLFPMKNKYIIDSKNSPHIFCLKPELSSGFYIISVQSETGLQEFAEYKLQEGHEICL